MTSIVARTLQLLEKGYMLEEVAAELGISVDRARLIASTLVASGLAKPARLDTANCACETCPLRRVCGFTPLRRAERS